MQITSEPLCLDPCARLKIQIPMHSISWGCPKILCHCDPIWLLINTFGIHLQPGCKSHEQIIHYRNAKNVQKQATVLLYFQMNSYKLTRKGFPVVWPADDTCGLDSLEMYFYTFQIFSVPSDNNMHPPHSPPWHCRSPPSSISPSQNLSFRRVSWYPTCTCTIS